MSPQEKSTHKHEVLNKFKQNFVKATNVISFDQNEKG